MFSRSSLHGILFTVAISVGLPSTADAADAKPMVVLLATGGTIAGAGSSPTDLSNYKNAYTGQQLVDAVPQIKDVADVRVEQIMNIGSPALRVEHWLTLANRANEVLADPAVTGIVVTHGTNTLEETAYFLNLTVKSDKPIVVVGSMRPQTALSADGPLNLYNAFRVAGAEAAKGKGVLVVLNDEINNARDVTKTNTYRVDTFRAGELGILGYVDEDRISFYRTTTKRHTSQSEFDVTGMKTLPQVDVLYSYVDPSPVTIRALVNTGTTGIVFAGTGAGGTATAQGNEIKAVMADAKLKEKPVVVRATRVGNGRVIPRPSNADSVAADTLNAQKARILLMLALTKTRDVKEIQRMFDEY